jgi:hypothetical protein
MEWTNLKWSREQGAVRSLTSKSRLTCQGRRQDGALIERIRPGLGNTAQNRRRSII